MFLVEYVQKRNKSKLEMCTGFYTFDSAMDFAIKLQQCSNIDSFMVSEIDISCANILYEGKNAE